MPDINGRAWLESKVTWKAPNIIVPSMIARGLNQVTTQAEVIVYQ